MIIGIIGHNFNLIIHSSWGYPIFKQSLLSKFRLEEKTTRRKLAPQSVFIFFTLCEKLQLRVSCRGVHWFRAHLFVHFSATTEASTAFFPDTVSAKPFHGCVLPFFTSGFFSPGGPGVVSFHFHMPWGPWREWQSWSFLQCHVSSFRPAVDNEASNEQFVNQEHSF